ncbi:M48 family metallopeptidase [Bremerella sp. T1]|uniref:M48 family metallopeptidase n=1 Tax=Bremerella sp. TYQ1 TaxID=3119568 RepID=UPI001CCFCDD7|nr:M48 family metallopeptidase [Bremerella volcania]UBM36082.1 M48 family metallopeptidase [Bremerella volcania]
MKIGFRCRHCHLKLTISASAAGTHQKCPRCLGEIVVPSPPTQVPIEQPGATQHRGEPLGETSSKENWKAPVQRSLRLPTQRAEHFEKCSPLKVPEFPVEGLKILKAFGPPVEKTEPTLAYKIGVIVVALVMLTLPTIYFTFVGSICYATYWYFAQGQYLLFPGMIGPLPYLVGAGIGSISAVVVFFLLKPVFARPANVARTRSITPQSDPMLFAFVSRVCDVVGSPFPSRIDVTYDVNASASFRLGLRSLLSGNDLVLTIGVPLVGALTTRQFAGVLAHEFGHFSQGTGMRLTFIIRAISEWFARVVFERDEWDKCLDMLCGPDFLPLSVITWPARSCVWLSRQLLRLLMNIGLLVGGFLLREMEFDADRYEARVAGSNEFAETSWRIQLAGYAWLHTQSQISQLVDRDILIDDVALLVRHHISSMSDAIKEQIHKDMKSGKCGLFDSHPCEAARFQNAQRENAPGIFTLEGDAKDLFADFETMAKNVTWDLYCQYLRRSVKRSTLQDTQSVLMRYRIGVGTVRPWNEPDYY